jgi:hypothetical protein
MTAVLAMILRPQVWLLAHRHHGHNRLLVLTSGYVLRRLLYRSNRNQPLEQDVNASHVVAAARSKRTTATSASKQTKFIDDPWKPLDPYASDSSVCEFRRMKAYRVPASLVPKPPQPAKKRGAKAKAPEPATQMISFDVFCNQAFRSFHSCISSFLISISGRANQSLVPKSVFLAPAFTEFESIIAMQSKERLTAQKKIKASLRAKQLNGESVPASIDPEEFDQEPAITGAVAQHEADDYDDGGFGFGDNDDVRVVETLE